MTEQGEKWTRQNLAARSPFGRLYSDAAELVPHLNTSRTRVAALEARLAAAVDGFRFICNHLGPLMPEGLPEGADVEWLEALGCARAHLDALTPKQEGSKSDDNAVS